MWRPDGWTLLLLIVVTAHVVLAPFTKVEESFNLQATHDILFHGTNLSQYDHLEFPGVVPRTCLGALSVATLAAPASLLFRWLGASKMASLYIVRLVLGTLTVASFAFLRQCISRQFGTVVAAFFMLLTAMQFHLPFYASRTLPNTLALPLTNLGLGLWLQGGRRPCTSITVLTAAAVLFRADVLLLLAPVGLHMLAARIVSVPRGLVCGVLAAAGSLAATVLVDSVFWRRWLWPEGEVLFFNTVLNKSHEWGVLPRAWYLTSALPRALHGAYPLALVAPLLERRTQPVLNVALAYVLLYSNLGHKEVRFLFPVLPLWNICAACTLQRLWAGRHKSAARRAAALGAAALLGAGLTLTCVTTLASRLNYPGGHALAQLHTLAAHDAAAALQQGHNLTVHVAVLPAQTGVSRFGELGSPWVYSKAEGLDDDQLALHKYDFLLSDKPQVPGYAAVTAVHGFERLRLATRSPRAALQDWLRRGRLPVEVATAPQVYIHQRLNLQG